MLASQEPPIRSATNERILGPLFTQQPTFPGQFPPAHYIIGGVPPRMHKNKVVVAQEPTRKLAVLLHADVVGSTAAASRSRTSSQNL